MKNYMCVRPGEETLQTISTMNSWDEFSWDKRHDGSWKGHGVKMSLDFYFRSWNGRKMTAHLYAVGENPVKGRTGGMGKKKEFQRKEWGRELHFTRKTLQGAKKGRQGAISEAWSLLWFVCILNYKSLHDEGLVPSEVIWGVHCGPQWGAMWRSMKPILLCYNIIPDVLYLIRKNNYILLTLLVDQTSKLGSPFTSQHGRWHHDRSLFKMERPYCKRRSQGAEKK